MSLPIRSFRRLALLRSPGLINRTAFVSSRLSSPSCPPRRHLNGPPGQGQGPLPDPGDEQDADNPAAAKSRSWGPTLFKMFESAATTFASVTILGLVGWSYTRYYKIQVLSKIENAFKPGDPMLELSGKDKGPGSEVNWIQRNEQPQINAILDGTDQGHYFLIVGEKGQGKSSMLLEAMHRVDGDGISMLDCHSDPEIFRIRLGKALDFEFHEDNIGSLFSIRGPRDASAILDIERAFNKFEKVALKRRNQGGTPLILVFNSMHLLKDDEDGRKLLELLQQRAEQWCASRLVTMVFNSDDYWVYERLKEHATRMEVLPVKDLPKEKALIALAKFRMRYFGETPSLELMERVYGRVGGRLSFLHRISKADDMISYCDEVCAREKTWFLNKCWILGENMDDDVMDQQKYASAAMVLAQALVRKEKELGDVCKLKADYQLPEIPLHEARQIMTRADFIQDYDQINVFTIDSRAMVRADSVPMQTAFREICSQEGFDDFLQETLDRISAIESLGRTKELTIKDLWNGGKYAIKATDQEGRPEPSVTFEIAPTKGEKQEDDV